ncbi:hypothetical protein ILUMI_05882 [Ignelater luminosus]|uniref:Uncharacterized protein n=1 Tax=Ignelater luminosus TaxID=2038154 RepID=A0A8K0D9N1_IGNLU|nr:hypothetical protein ILUMI_05882 [Ignelater luminosus]
MERYSSKFCTASPCLSVQVMLFTVPKVKKLTNYDKKYDEEKLQRALQEIKSGNSKKAVSKNPYCKLGKEHFTPIPKSAIQNLADETTANRFRACGLQPWNPNSIDFSKCLRKQFNKIIESVSNNTQDQFSKSQSIIGYEEFAKIVGNRKIEKLVSSNMLVCANTKCENFELLKQIYHRLEPNPDSTLNNSVVEIEDRTPSKTDKNSKSLNVLNHELALSLPKDTNMEKGEQPPKSISVDDTGPLTSIENLGHVYNEQTDGLEELERRNISNQGPSGNRAKQRRGPPVDALHGKSLVNGQRCVYNGQTLSGTQGSTILLDDMLITERGIDEAK